MKLYHILFKCLLPFTIFFLEKKFAYAQFNNANNCGFGEIFVTPLSKNLNQCSSIKSLTCKEWYVGPLSNTKTIVLFISNVMIDCNKADIIVYNENRIAIYDLCSAKKSNLEYFFVTNDAKYLIIKSILMSEGTVDFSINFNYYQSSINNANQTTSTSQTTSASKATSASQTTTGATTTKTASRTTAPQIELPSMFPKECGIQAIEPIFTNMSRIIGGINAKPHSWPWQVMITDEDKLCGGSIITKQWVISAAHCTKNFNLSAFKINLGSHDINRRFEETRVTLKHSKIIDHPAYKGPKSNFDYDISLIKLEKPIEFNDKISPICLPNVNDRPTLGRVGYVTGWGDTSFQDEDEDNAPTNETTTPRPFENFLKQTSITIISKRECADFLKSRQICAGNQNPVHDACQGDSGGPFVLRKNKQYYLAGVVSSGLECDGYGIYTNVLEFMDWIVENIRSN